MLCAKTFLNSEALYKCIIFMFSRSLTSYLSLMSDLIVFNLASGLNWLKI